nr:aldo/keto reductase [uncultured Desulfobacter sp.]
MNESLIFENGDRMPILGLGTWKAAPGEVYQAVKEAIAIGYRHIDCAAVYGNEQEVGKAIEESIKKNKVTRKDLWVTSKLWCNSHGRENVIPAIEKTLADLKLDYLDLYEIHWPVAIKPELGIVVPGSADGFIPLADCPLSDTWKGMEDIVEKGLVRHIGVSNFSISKLNALLETARIKPEMNQVEIHPYMHQDELASWCTGKRIHLTAYSPLGSFDRPAGLKAEDEPVLLEDPIVKEIAEKKGASPAQVLISWAIHRGIAVIPKSVNPERLKQNFDAQKLVLSSEEMEKLKSINRDRRYVDAGFWEVVNGPYTRDGIWNN